MPARSAAVVVLTGKRTGNLNDLGCTQRGAERGENFGVIFLDDPDPASMRHVETDILRFHVPDLFTPAFTKRLWQRLPGQGLLARAWACKVLRKAWGERHGSKTRTGGREIRLVHLVPDFRSRCRARWLLVVLAPGRDRRQLICLPSDARRTGLHGASDRPHHPSYRVSHPRHAART